MQTFWVLDLENDGDDWGCAQAWKAESMHDAVSFCMGDIMDTLASEACGSEVTATVMCSEHKDGRGAKTFRLTATAQVIHRYEVEEVIE